LINRNSVIVPVTVIFLVVSYAAVPWWANSDNEKIDKQIPKPIHIMSLRMKGHSSLVAPSPPLQAESDHASSNRERFERLPLAWMANANAGNTNPFASAHLPGNP
jgi:hypothetical protein